jgi:hypothetical protein
MSFAGAAGAARQSQAHEGGEGRMLPPPPHPSAAPPSASGQEPSHQPGSSDIVLHNGRLPILPGPSTQGQDLVSFLSCFPQQIHRTISTSVSAQLSKVGIAQASASAVKATALRAMDFRTPRALRLFKGPAGRRVGAGRPFSSRPPCPHPRCQGRHPPKGTCRLPMAEPRLLLRYAVAP